MMVIQFDLNYQKNKKQEKQNFQNTCIFCFGEIDKCLFCASAENTKKYKSKPWADHTLQEKINYAIQNNWYMQDYIYRMSLLRFQNECKNNPCIIPPYELWIKINYENGVLD